MKLWTIQPIEVWKELETTGRFICNIDKSEFVSGAPIIHNAYDWLVAQMEKRISPRPMDVSYPIWAWYRIDGENKKPDFRTDMFRYEAKVHNVCIELALDETDVLLSCYEAWHSVLNNGFFNDETDEEKWEKKDEWFESLRGKEREDAKLASWQNIFVLDEPYVQATFWELRMEDVCNVKFL